MRGDDLPEPSAFERLDLGGPDLPYAIGETPISACSKTDCATIAGDGLSAASIASWFDCSHRRDGLPSGSDL